MSTRSLTVFLDDVGREFCILYKQHDGFPIFYGRFLSECLRDEAIVGRMTPEDLARSIPKLAKAEYDEHDKALKEACKASGSDDVIEEFTLYERTTFEPHNWSERMADEWGVDYIYTISCYEDYNRKPMIQVFAVRSGHDEKEKLKSLFCGFGNEFFEWVESLKIDEQCAVGFDDDEDSYDEKGNLIGLLA